MKSFLHSSKDAIQKSLQAAPSKFKAGRLTAHYELYKQVADLDGSLVNCGVISDRHFISFAKLRLMADPSGTKKLIAFEKHEKSMFFDASKPPHGSLYYKTQNKSFNAGLVRLNLLQQRITVCNEFVSGYVPDAIPQYLIENPELKISFLTVNLDEYEGCMTALQFFYPRLISGGILVFDNFNKAEEDYKAICDYFTYTEVDIHCYGEGDLPHFIVKE